VLCDHRVDGAPRSGSFNIRLSSKPQTPVVIITGSSQREQRLEAVKAGVTDFLEKPIDRQMLIARLRHLLEIESLRREQDQLLNFIVHDMKQPVTTIAINSQWVSEQKGLPEEMRGAVGDVINAVQRLKRFGRRSTGMICYLPTS